MSTNNTTALLTQNTHHVSSLNTTALLTQEHAPLSDHVTTVTSLYPSSGLHLCLETFALLEASEHPLDGDGGVEAQTQLVHAALCNEGTHTRLKHSSMYMYNGGDEGGNLLCLLG